MRSSELLRLSNGMIESPMLWHKKFAKGTEEQGFKLNPRDLCVANEPVNGSNLTLVWHVDDVVISHLDSKMVDDCID